MTFEKWLDSRLCITGSKVWTKSDVRAGFEAGRVEGLEEAARECERMAAEVLVTRDEQYRYEQEHGYSNAPLRAGYTSEIQALEERAAAIRALASTPPGEVEAK